MLTLTLLTLASQKDGIIRTIPPENRELLLLSQVPITKQIHECTSKHGLSADCSNNIKEDFHDCRPRAADKGRFSWSRELSDHEATPFLNMTSRLQRDANLVAGHG